jgi:two-component system response regulator MprA
MVPCASPSYAVTFPDIAEVNSPLIVVADDDDAMRMLCRVNLELDGYQVAEAGNAAELAEAISGQDVAVILLDVQLGEDDGIAIAKALRIDRPEVGIAFLTGSVQGRADETAKELAVEMIGKPFNLEELSETVARLARRG